MGILIDRSERLLTAVLATFMTMSAMGGKPASAGRAVVMGSFITVTLVWIVDAINEDAARFYRHFGFIPFPDMPRRLFLVRESLAKYL